MRRSHLLSAGSAVLFTLMTLTARSALHGRLPATLGGTDYQAYYDDALDITWAANANINENGGPFNKGIDTWENQMAWVAGVTIGGISGWRLPNMDVDGDGIVYGHPGETNWDGKTPTIEMTDNEFFYHGHMNLIQYNVPAPFKNLEYAPYWSSTDYFGGPQDAWNFEFDGGTIHADHKWNGGFAWPVHDGDVGNLHPGNPGQVALSGSVKTTEGVDICAMVLASGQFMFSCNPAGEFSLPDLPSESDGTVKRQIYADGFFPKVDTLAGSTNDAVVMTRSGTCPDYNANHDAGFVPNSAGKRIDITGKVLLQNSQTPICAMALANGQYMFTCDGTGNYALNIPLDTNGQFKLQVYADGFAPITQKFDEFSVNNDVRMARAMECQ